MKLTQKKVQDLFYYIDGHLIRKRTGKKSGGSPNSRGYGTVKVGNKHYLAHRLVFLFVHGYLPDVLDHRDGNKLNNNVVNLRPATAQQNHRNTPVRKHSTSGVTGVNKHKGKWRAYIYVDSTQIYLGRFLVKDLAIEARRIAEEKYFGEFAYAE